MHADLTIILARLSDGWRSRPITLTMPLIAPWRCRVAHGDMKRSRNRRLKAIGYDQARKLKADRSA